MWGRLTGDKNKAAAAQPAKVMTESERNEEIILNNLRTCFALLRLKHNHIEDAIMTMSSVDRNVMLPFSNIADSPQRDDSFVDKNFYKAGTH